MTAAIDRGLVVAGAVAGVLGVALSAAAAHVTGGGPLDISARFLMFHAPALMALAALAGSGPVHAATARLAGAALCVGLALFSGDLAHRAFTGAALFAPAAPIGGIVLMAGWALVAVSAMFGRRVEGPRSDARDRVP